jgi:ABC-type multidrug transport system ATPase subunit
MNIDSAATNNEIGFVSELMIYALMATSAQDILALHRDIRPRWDESFVEEAAKIMNLPLKSSFQSLSRGQKMQLCYIAARAFYPKLLLLDEITSVLDPVARAFLTNDLETFVKKGGTAVVATNIVHEIQDIADSITLITMGKISFNSSKAEVTKNFQRVVRGRGDHHEIFGNQHLVEVGIDPNGSTHFLIEKEIESFIPKEFLSDIPATAAEAFIYLTRVK